MIHHARRHDRISIDPVVMPGKPVIRSTRITVEQILRELGAEMATGEILAAHSRLTADDSHAAQAFAADWSAGETVSLAGAGKLVLLVPATDHDPAICQESDYSPSRIGSIDC